MPVVKKKQTFFQRNRKKLYFYNIKLFCLSKLRRRNNGKPFP